MITEDIFVGGEKHVAAPRDDITDLAKRFCVGRDTVEAHGGRVQTIPLVPGVSTTTLVQRIRSTTA